MSNLIIFDLDGTLADTRTDLANAVNAARSQYAFPALSLDEIISYVGNGQTKLIERSFHDRPNTNTKEAAALFSEYYGNHLTDATKLYSGVFEGISSIHAHGSYAAVLSNKPGDFTRRILKYFGLHKFLISELGGGDLKDAKPAPDGIYESIRRAGEAGFINNGSNVFMAGDHYTDLAAAQNAGIKSIFCTYGFGNRKGITPDYTVSAFSEIPLLLQ